MPNYPRKRKRERKKKVEIGFMRVMGCGTFDMWAQALYYTNSSIYVLKLENYCFKKKEKKKKKITGHIENKRLKHPFLFLINYPVK